MINLTNDWSRILREEFQKQYFLQLKQYLLTAYATETIYPPKEQIFTALELTPYQNVKVVILGQDPYHGQGQAHGLAFSVLPGVPIPPSLLNIYKELKTDLNCSIPDHGYLISWAKQGVLLLNTTMTVKANQPNSHKDLGWQLFTDQIIKKLNQKHQPVVFMLWGNHAKSKARLISNSKHLVLQAAHPSPFSANKGFFGCKHFSKANEFLLANGLHVIDWQIPNMSP